LDAIRNRYNHRQVLQNELPLVPVRVDPIIGFYLEILSARLYIFCVSKTGTGANSDGNTEVFLATAPSE